MMYYNNRLIKAYHRVGCQLNANNRQGIGVIGVIQCNFLEPTHNKQDFEKTDKYRNAIRNVAEKLEDYCKEIRFKRKKSNLSDNVPVEETEKRPDQNWAHCDECQKWRKLPDGINTEQLPEEWFCYMNPDPQFRSCETMEEPEDSDSEQPTNLKTYKKQEREDKKRQDEMEEFKEFQEEKRKRINETLRRKKEDAERALRQKTSTPNTPQTPREGTSARSLTTSSSHPVIMDEVSLSKNPSRSKRPQPTIPQSKSKIPKRSSEERKSDTPMSLRSHAALEARSTGNDVMEEMRDTSAQMQGPQGNDEEEMNLSTAANDGTQVMEEGMISIIQAQEQQDRLMELLQSVGKERDSLKEKVKELQAQLDVGEKQCAVCQTAREKAEELSREKERLLEAHSRQNQEQVKQIEDLTNEIQKLRSQVKQLEEEKASLSALRN